MPKFLLSSACLLVAGLAAAASAYQVPDFLDHEDAESVVRDQEQEAIEVSERAAVLSSEIPEVEEDAGGPGIAMSVSVSDIIKEAKEAMAASLLAPQLLQRYRETEALADQAAKELYEAQRTVVLNSQEAVRASREAATAVEARLNGFSSEINITERAEAARAATVVAELAAVTAQAALARYQNFSNRSQFVLLEARQAKETIAKDLNRTIALGRSAQEALLPTFEWADAILDRQGNGSAAPSETVTATLASPSEVPRDEVDSTSRPMIKQEEDTEEIGSPGPASQLLLWKIVLCAGTTGAMVALAAWCCYRQTG